jgi:phospholipid transport system substrate-binding protein
MRALAIVSMLCGAALAGAVCAADDSPETAVRETVDRVIAALRDPALADDAKRRQVKLIVDERFDYSSMASRVLATNWRLATEAQRARFTELFQALLAETYWGKISAYRNERVRYLGGAAPTGEYATVRTVIVTPGADVPIDYKLLRKDRRWLAYDVVIEQASLVRNYRGEYQEIVKNGGIDGLLRHLEAAVP